jgi:ATP-dependent RNA helicase RhlE
LKVLPTKDKTYCFQQPFKDIKKLAMGILPTVHVEATPENTTVDAIIKKYILSPREKTELIIKLITEGNWKQILVFTRTKQGANKLTESMISAGIKAAAIHGNKDKAPVPKP